MAESFFSNLKNERVHHVTYEDLEQVRSADLEYMEVFYKPQRLHQTPGFISPVDLRR